MKKYYLPYGWLLKTRASGFDVFNIVTIFVNYSMVSFLFLLLYYENVGGWLIDYIFAFSGMMVLYECGYIFNDLITVRFERNPTYRISPKTFYDRMLKHIENLLTIRIVYFTICVYWIYIYRKEYLLTYVALSIGMLILYSLHNYFRSGINGFTFCALVHCKYFIPMSVFLNIYELGRYYIFIFFVAIFEQSILHWSEKEYFSYSFVKKEYVEKFRLIYFCTITIIFFFICSFDALENKFIILPIVYFFYRLLGWILMKNKQISKKIETRRNMYRK